MESTGEQGGLSQHDLLHSADHIHNTRMCTSDDHDGPVPRLHCQGLLDDGTYRASQVHARKDRQRIGDLDQLGSGAHLLFEGT